MVRSIVMSITDLATKLGKTAAMHAKQAEGTTATGTSKYLKGGGGSAMSAGLGGASSTLGSGAGISSGTTQMPITRTPAGISTTFNQVPGAVKPQLMSGMSGFGSRLPMGGSMNLQGSWSPDRVSVTNPAAAAKYFRRTVNNGT
jgi:hypothetical protein